MGRRGRRQQQNGQRCSLCVHWGGWIRAGYFRRERMNQGERTHQPLRLAGIMAMAQSAINRKRTKKYQEALQFSFTSVKMEHDTFWEGELLVPKRTSKISDTTLVEIIAKRLLGKSQSEIAIEYGVSTQTIQYYEAKETSQDLKRIVLQRIAETVGDALGQQALEQLAIWKDDRPDTQAGAPSRNFAMTANHT